MNPILWSEVRLPLLPGAALVTGAASGIGRAVATAFTILGTPVAAVDRSRPDAEFTTHCERLHVPCIALQRDVRDFAAAESAVHEAEAALGPVSMLVTCAGIRQDNASWKMSEDEWRNVLDVDLTGSFTYARALASRMRERQAGRIVFVASINGLRGKFGQANYAAAKAGLVGLAKTLARELGPRQVTVNVVAPGMIVTPMITTLPPQVVEQARHESVLGGLGQPEDVAAAILFLCSTLAQHVTGEVVRVDGGQAL